jgi:TetR/AcrR family transcriptional regulator, cholesterol catabolism regulator
MCARQIDPVRRGRAKEILIKAGYAEILEKGIRGVTIDSVVARANSSKGGALHYFPTKMELLFAVFEWLLSHVNRTLDEVTEAGASPRAKLAAELEVLFHSTEVNRKLYVVLFDFASLGVREERFRALFAAFFERCRERDMAIVEEGIRQKQFRRLKAGDAASTIRALVDGYCLQWLMGPEAVPVETYRDLCRAVLGSYLLP